MTLAAQVRHSLTNATAPLVSPRQAETQTEPWNLTPEKLVLLVPGLDVGR